MEKQLSDQIKLKIYHKKGKSRVFKFGQNSNVS